MAKVSISEAARLAGVSRSALYRGYISQGKISVERDYRNAPVVDTSELLRVFGDISKATADHQHDQGVDMAQLQAEVARLQALVQLYESQLAEAKEREDWLKRKVDQLQPQALAGPETKRKWWWPW
jgi:DNA-binding transcriptional MerR regulator